MPAPNYLVEFQIVVRNRADSADLLVVNSIRGDASAYIKDPPKGDGAGFDPLTGDSTCASYTGTIVDQITSGTSRVVTSQLEDVNQRLQLGYLKTYIKSRRDGGAYDVLCAGYLTLLRLVDDGYWEFTVQDANRVQGGVELFNAASTTLITDFLTTWPNRGVLFGGPMKGTWLAAGLGRLGDARRRYLHRRRREPNLLPARCRPRLRSAELASRRRLGPDPERDQSGGVVAATESRYGAAARHIRQQLHGVGRVHAQFPLRGSSY
jgi:hypothetical protein